MKKIILALLLLCGIAFGQTTGPNLNLNAPAFDTHNWDVLLNQNWTTINNIFGVGDCGDGTHALGFVSSSKSLYCQTVGGTNALTLEGATWESPLGIGSTTPAPGIFTTLIGTYIYGVAHTEKYPGATMVDRVNAANADCVTGANGCTSHIIDSTGEAVVQSFAGTSGIQIGDNIAGHEATWIHPAVCQWSLALTGGAGSLLKHFGNSRITGPSPHLAGGCQIINTSGSNGASEVYLNALGGGNACYFRASGLVFESKNVPVSSNAVMRLPVGCDTSFYEDIEVLSYVAGVSAILIGNTGGPCCSFIFNRITANDNGTGGIPFKMVGNGSGIPNGIFSYASSYDHPAAGQPNISISNTSTTIPAVIHFFGTYEEGNSTSDTTTCLNQLTGLMQASFNAVEVKAEVGSSTAPVFCLSGTQPMSFSLRDLSTPLNFTQPVVAVQNNITSTACSSPPCNISTDSKGNLNQYTTNITYADAVVSPTVTVSSATGLTQCATFNSTGVLSGTGSPCGTGGTTVTIIPAYCGAAVGGGNGTTYVLNPAVNANSFQCNQTAATELPMPYAATASKLYVNSGVAGAVGGSGVVTVYKNGSATALTCTLGTSLTCNDTTHTVGFSAGDTWSVRVTTGQASDTTQSVKAQFQYQ